MAISTPAQISEDARRLLQKTGDTISKPLNALSRIFNEALDGAEGRLSYLPGPFAPFELGRENRAAQGSTRHPDQVQQQQDYYPQTPVGGDGFAPPIQTPYKQRVRRPPASPSTSVMGTPPGTPGYTPDYTPSRVPPGAAITPPRLQSLQAGDGGGTGVSRTPTPNLDLAAMQAQIDSAHEQAAQAAKETLLQIFPAIEPEVVQMVLEANDGDLGQSIEALLEMNSGD